MKLKIEILNKIIDKLNSKEIDLLIYLIQRQSKYGQVQNIYYKDVKEATGISNFYMVMYSLEEKGFIQIDYSNSNCWNMDGEGLIQSNNSNSNSKYWNITVLENQFLNEKFQKYLSLNFKLFTSEEFRKLNVNMKKFILRLFSLKDSKKKEKNYYLKDYLKQYKVLTELETLKKYFNINVSGERYYFDIKETYLTKNKFEKDTYYRHKIKSICSKFGMSYTEQEFEDVLKLYAYYLKENAKDTTNKILSRLLKGLNACIKIKKLQPALVNYICLAGNTVQNRINEAIKKSNDAWQDFDYDYNFSIDKQDEMDIIFKQMMDKEIFSM